MDLKGAIGPRLLSLCRDLSQTTCLDLWKAIDVADREEAIGALLIEDEPFARGRLCRAVANHYKMRYSTASHLNRSRLTFLAARSPLREETTANRLLVSLHIGCRTPMLEAFMNALGIKHKNGVITTDLAAPVTDRVGLAQATSVLFNSFNHRQVVVYLASLTILDPPVWNELGPVLNAHFDQTEIS